MESRKEAYQNLHLVDDQEAFARLSARIQQEVISRLDWVMRIKSAPHGKKGPVISAAAEALNVSVPTVSRFVSRFAAGGWMALVDQRGNNNPSQPEAFKNFVRSLHLQCQRATSGREVHRMLVERWRLWKRTGASVHAIPGYETPPPAGPKGYPHGFSEDSVLRLRPDDYCLTVARQGTKRAAGYLPSVLKTRVGTRFGQVVFFDDQDYDVKIVARGSSQQAVRPQGFNCLDYLSGCFMHHAIRLRWFDKEHDQFRTLTSADFTWFVISYLQKHGYRRDEHGTTFVFEHGTATGYNNQKLSTFGGFSSFDEALAGVSGGKIRVERSGRFNSPAFAGLLFRPQSSGNPNHKAPLESMFNLVRNRMASFQGATGRNRDEKPAEQYGLDLYAAQMLKLEERLDEYHRDLIRFPLLTAEQFGDVARVVYESINCRTDHDLQGWEDLGFIAPQMRFTPDDRSPWLSQHEISKLPDYSQTMLLAHAEVPGHARPWKLSPADVARQYKKELSKLPDHTIPLLIPREWARPVTVRDNREIWIKDQLLGAEAFKYVARIDRGDIAQVIQPGTKLLAYLNPFAPERLVICKENGAYVGTLDEMTRAGFMDTEAILEQVKGVSALKADLDTGVRPHLAGIMADRAAMKRNNERLADGKPTTKEEIAAARAASARDGVRTRKINEIAAAMGSDALSPSNLLPDEDADDMQDDCTPVSRPFSAAQFLNPTEDDND